ncbi:MAG: hypothetical protein PHE55_19610 [Methylococcaceae bacterium]|nr:hypothetical protein [Methylococcaceae bacterium]
MKTLINMLKAFWQEETGLTMVEYAVAGAVIALAAATAFTNLGKTVANAIVDICKKVASNANSCAQ